MFCFHFKHIVMSDFLVEMSPTFAKNTYAELTLYKI